jgi:ABC-type sugar transport system ATPase subunit
LELTAKLADGPVELGIRPEDVMIAERDAPAPLRGVVQSVEFRGHDAVIEVRIGNQTLLLRGRPDARTVVGASMDFTLTHEHRHFFDAGSEGARVEVPPKPSHL